MILGYARVSKGEEQDTKTQMIALKEAGAKRFFEEKASGGRWDRPELHKMLDQLREDDVVTVWKFDRLTRSLKDLLQIMDTINKAGAGFKSITENIDTTTPAGLMMMQMLGCFAEFERAMIRQRTKAGLKTARDEGRIGGRPAKLTDAQIKESLSMIKSGKKTAADIARLFRVHRTTISRLILKHNLDEFETPTEEKIVDKKKQNKSKPIPKQAKKKPSDKKKSRTEEDDEDDLFYDESDLNDDEDENTSKNTANISLSFYIENNNSFVRGRKKSNEAIAKYILNHYDSKKISDGEYELKIPYEDDEDLDDIMEELFTEIECDASRYSCYPQRLDALEIGKERCW